MSYLTFDTLWLLLSVLYLWCLVAVTPPYISDPRDTIEESWTQIMRVAQRVCRGGVNDQATQDGYYLAFCTSPAQPAPASLLSTHMADLSIYFPELSW